MTDTETEPTGTEPDQEPPTDNTPLELRSWGMSGQPSTWALSTWTSLIDTIRLANRGEVDASAVQDMLDATFPDRGYQADDIVLAHPPTAEFTPTVNDDELTVRVELAGDEDLGVPDEQCVWDFGDGVTTSAAAGWDHIYETPGTYTVRCSVPVGGVVYTTSQSVTVGEQPEEQPEPTLDPGVAGRDATVFTDPDELEEQRAAAQEAQVPVAEAQAEAVATYTGIEPGQTWAGPDDQPGVEQSPPDQEEAPAEQPDDGPYDPADHTVDDVLTYAADHPDEVDAIIAAEEAGKGRVGILDKL